MAEQKIITVITSIEISEVKENLDSIHSQHFNENEVEELSKRHVRSTAGWLVLKQALCRLLEQMQIAQLTEKNFYLKRTESGRPYIENITLAPIVKQELLKKIFVSISHTKTTAYGLAVMEP